MRIHYCRSARSIIDDTDRLLPVLKQAGVSQIWLGGSFSGKGRSAPDEVVEACAVLESLGFDAGASYIPVGHPGNSLNPEDSTLDLRIADTWRYRINRHGEPVYYIGDIEAGMIADNVTAVQQMRDAGIVQHFMDDDLRTGNWGPEIQGCFCDDCIQEFRRYSGREVDREDLSRAIEAAPVYDGGGRDLLRDWVAYQCHKVNTLMRAMALPGVELGLMVMHAGDERHGIDLHALRRMIPGLLVRVGEAHFSERDYGSPEGKAEELAGVLHHLNLVGRELAYSETTIFPPRALTPRSWVHKMRLALAAGLPNLFFMGGSWTIEGNYWEAEIGVLPGLRRFEERCAPHARLTPLHVAYGTHGSFGEAILPPVLPFMAGLPATPVRGAEAAQSAPANADVLLFAGEFHMTPEWREALPRYKHVIVDAAAVQRNPGVFGPEVRVLDGDLASGSDAVLAELRAVLNVAKVAFPRVVQGSDVSLFWLGEQVALLNLLDETNSVVVEHDGVRREVTLPPLAVVAAPLPTHGGDLLIA